jgi:hypothetical protein
MLSSRFICRTCCKSTIPDYHIHCTDRPAVRPRDGRLFSLDEAVTVVLADQSDALLLTDSAEAASADNAALPDRKRPRDQLEQQVELLDTNWFGASSEYGVASGGKGGVGDYDYYDIGDASCGGGVGNLDLEDSALRSSDSECYAGFVEAYTATMVADGHIGSFCIREWDNVKNVVSLCSEIIYSYLVL